MGLLLNVCDWFILFDQSMNYHRHIVLFEVILRFVFPTFCSAIFWRKCVGIGCACGSFESRSICCSTRQGARIGGFHRECIMVPLVSRLRPGLGFKLFNVLLLFLFQPIFLFNRDLFQLCEVVEILDVGDDVSVAHHLRLGLVLVL